MVQLYIGSVAVSVLFSIIAMGISHKCDALASAPTDTDITLGDIFDYLEMLLSVLLWIVILATPVVNILVVIAFLGSKLKEHRNIKIKDLFNKSNGGK